MGKTSLDPDDVKRI